MELTLTQQFDFRIMSDAAKTLPEDILLQNLKEAHKLLKQKTHILDGMLSTNSQHITFMDMTDPSNLFNQHMIFQEFEKYTREQKVDILLGIMKTLMYTDNHIKEVLLCACV
jgi:hypothetical protein